MIFNPGFGGNSGGWKLIGEYKNSTTDTAPYKYASCNVTLPYELTKYDQLKMVVTVTFNGTPYSSSSVWASVDVSGYALLNANDGDMPTNGRMSGMGVFFVTKSKTTISATNQKVLYESAVTSGQGSAFSTVRLSVEGTKDPILGISSETSKNTYKEITLSANVVLYGFE